MLDLLVLAEKMRLRGHTRRYGSRSLSFFGRESALSNEMGKSTSSHQPARHGSTPPNDLGSIADLRFSRRY